MRTRYDFLKLWLVLFLLFLTSEAFCADVLIPLADARLSAGPNYTNRSIRVFPMSSPTVVNASVIGSYFLSTSTDTNGNAYLTNLQAGLYRVQVLAPPAQDIFKFLLTTNDVGFVNIANNLVADSTATFPAGSVAWAAAVSDARYGSSSAAKYLLQGTNIILLTNGNVITINGKTDTNVVLAIASGASLTNATWAANATNWLGVTSSNQYNGSFIGNLASATNYNATNLVGNAPVALQAGHATNSDNAVTSTFVTGQNGAILTNVTAQSVHSTNSDLSTTATGAIFSTNYVGVINWSNFPTAFFQSNSPPMNLKRDFGAKGDGTTDDTAALQAAFNALASPSGITNGWLFIPEGRYKITSTVTIPPSAWPPSPVLSTNSGFKITGAGMHRTVLDFTSIGNAAGILSGVTSLGQEGALFREIALKGPANGGSSVGIGIGLGGQSFAGQLYNFMDCAIYGFGTGLACSNIWNVTVDNCNISSNNFFGVKFYDTHNFLVKDCVFSGCWITPTATAGGTAVGMVGPAPGVGDNGCLINCMIQGWTNAIMNNELNLGVENCHFEACDSYYITTTNLAYAQVCWFGGYILEYVNRPWIVSPALMQFPRGFTQKAMFLNCILDNFATGRPYFNVISDGSAATLPTFIHSQPVSYLVDGVGNTNTMYPLNIPQSIANTFLAPLETPNYTNWTKFNSFTGWMGVRVCPSTDRWLGRLGRYSVSGLNNKYHQILVLNSDLTTNGYVTLPKSSVVQDWVWAACAIKLKAGTTNYIITDAAGAADDYLAGDSTPLYLDPIITNIFSAYSTALNIPNIALNATNKMYGPVNYQILPGSGTFNEEGTIAGTFIGNGLSITNIPLSALQQSGATLNQVIGWNGTTWVPQTVSSGSGASNFGQLNSGINTTAVMIVSNGASLYPTNTGTVYATWSAQATHSTNADVSTYVTGLNGAVLTNVVAQATHATNADNATLATSATSAISSTTSTYVTGLNGAVLTNVVAQATHATNADTAISATSATTSVSSGLSTNLASGGKIGNASVSTNLNNWMQIIGPTGIPALSWDAAEHGGVGTFDFIGDASFQGKMTNTTFAAGVHTSDANGAFSSSPFLPLSMMATNVYLVQGTNMYIVTNYSGGVFTYSLNISNSAGSGVTTFAQLQGGINNGQHMTVGSGSTFDTSGGGQIIASGVTGSLTNNAATATTSTNLINGGTLGGTVTVSVNGGKTQTTLQSTNAAMLIADDNGGYFKFFDPMTNTAWFSGVYFGSATNLYLAGATTVENGSYNVLTVTDFWPTNTHGLFGDTNLANNGAIGQVLTYVAASNHIAWVNATGGGGGSGLPGTNQIIAYGDSRATNAIAQYGNSTVISNNLGSIIQVPGAAPGSAIMIGQGNGVSNTLSTVSGSNDLVIAVGNTTITTYNTKGSSTSYESFTNPVTTGNGTVTMDMTLSRQMVATNANVTVNLANVPTSTDRRAVLWMTNSGALNSTITITFGGFAPITNGVPCSSFILTNNNTKYQRAGLSVECWPNVTNAAIVNFYTP